MCVTLRDTLEKTPHRISAAFRLVFVFLLFANSASAFTDFGDGESGFYQTYRRAFQEVWEAEKEWGDFESVSGSDIANGGGGGGGGCGKGEAPKMGLSGDSYEVADAFYASWSTFVSRLSFGWVDEHNVNEVGPRAVSFVCFLTIGGRVDRTIGN